MKTILKYIALLVCLTAASALVSCLETASKQNSSFPGVSRDLASFCANRPSLPIELAAMVVHVKKDVSFNYKIYLFSADYVFQTGQVIPRDDFRIHSFPVKFKRISEFWPGNVPAYRSAGLQNEPLVSSDSFNLKQFLKPVPLSPQKHKPKSATRYRSNSDDLHFYSPLSGESSFRRNHTSDVSLLQLADHVDELDNLNRQVEFDRDDQVTVIQSARLSSSAQAHNSHEDAEETDFSGDSIIPVGSFSSFHVNITYLVRKDFDQDDTKLIRILVDADEFLVKQVLLINLSNNPLHEDYGFLVHKLLRDPNTRITAINQIYEDWITRNFYTIVYIQRRLEAPIDSSSELTIVNDRLVFRGASAALIGADQLDYSVKAAAFITEKNGLHYYLEFLKSSKFYLCAIDWTKRPFRIIDSRQFPIKATRNQLDNEELLLCPPAVCYSNQPMDEVVSYGRMPLTEKIQHEVMILTASQSSFTKNPSTNFTIELNTTSSLLTTLHNSSKAEPELVDLSMVISLDKVIESIRSAASQLETKIHLRDWTWSLERKSNIKKDHQNGTSFGWRYELARRNDIKVKLDTYGYAITGHDIDASYRVYNELYLISANHLIEINYTMPNETVISSHPLGEEFFELSSTLVDPITGAFYDRYANHIYFFKGDRYLGYDYASKKPLDDFVTKPSITSHEPEFTSMVTSLPVVGILGRQHQVDGVYHDLASDLVYIFSGMKFYSFEAHEFKNGSFKPDSLSLPQMLCINEHFLSGCNFDKAFQNPCNTGGQRPNHKLAKLELQDGSNELDKDTNKVDESPGSESKKDIDFNERQQMKLRSIASKSGMLTLLVENGPLSKVSKPMEPFASNSNDLRPEKLFLNLLMAMIMLTVLMTIIMIVVLLFWTKEKIETRSSGHCDDVSRSNNSPSSMEQSGRHYLSNQQQYHSRRAHYHSGQMPSVRYTVTNRSSAL